MRKLFAMVATVAVVLSMFSGIAFAGSGNTYVITAGTLQTADTTPLTFVVDKTNLNTITATKDGNPFTLNFAGVAADGIVTAITTPGAADLSGYVSLQLRDGDDGNYVFATLPIASLVITSDTSVFSSGSTAGLKNIVGELRSKVTGAKLNYTGTVNVTFGSGATADTTPVTAGTFVYSVNTAGGPEKVSLALAGSTPAVFYRKAIVDLDPSTVDFDATFPLSFTASIRDGNGNAIKSTYLPNQATIGNVQLVGPVTVNPAVLSSVDGTMVFVITSWNGGTSGNYELTINGVPSATLKVGNIDSLDIEVNKSTGIYYNVPQRLVFDLTGPENGNVQLTVTGALKTTLQNAMTGLTFIGDVANVALDGDGEAQIVAVADFAVAVGGDFSTKSANVKVTMGNYTADELNIKVVKAPEGYYDVIKSAKLEKVTVGTHATVVGGADYDVIHIGTNGAPVAAETKTFSVYIDGSQSQDKVAAGTSFNISASTLATKEVRIVTYFDGTKKLDKTYSVAVTGWDVTYDVKTMTVNEKQNVVFTIKDKDGNPINNARIYIDGSSTPAIDLNKVNIIDGTYTVKDLKFSNIGSKSVVVKNGSGTTMASFTNGIVVLGNVVYDVTSDTEQVLLGAKETVSLTVSDGTTTIVPTNVWKQVGTGAPTLVPSSDVKVSNGKVQVTLTPTSTKKITLRPGNAAGDKIGETIIEVVSPKLVVLDDNTAVTENVKSVVKFQIVDPRDDTVLDNDVTLNEINFTGLEVRTADGKSLLTESLNGANEQSIMIIASDVDWDVDEIPEVELTIKLDATDPVTVDGSFEVKKAALTSTPDSLVFGQGVSLTLSYKDANGNGIADKKLYLGDNASGTYLGKTDSNGQFIYVAAASSTTTFAAATDVTGEFATLNVPVGFDNAAPVVSAPATTDKSTATITVTDNVRIVRVMFNGVEDTSFFPGATYTKNVTLKVGANTFTVQAMDANYNTVNETITITYTPAANNSTVLQGSAVARKGDNLFVQVAQFEKLGATKSWNATTKTATFTAGGKTVEVTIGSTIAKVDGATVTMPAAPYIANNLTMVPTRFISEALGWKVDWAAGDVVTITLP